MVEAERVNPDMVRLARDARGLTQQELAKRLRISQGKLSKYEKGLLPVTDADLAAMVRELGYPDGFFYQPETLEGLGSRCTYFRKRKSTAVRDLRCIESLLNIFRCQVVRLLDGVEVETDGEFIRMDMNENRSPHAIAQAIRGAWRVPMGPVRNTVAMVENAGAIVYKWDFGSTKMDAVSLMAPDGPPIIFLNSSIPGDRSRFTLMHEVGHLVMHRIPNPSEHLEKEADAFASELLMPADEVRPFLRNPSLGVLADLKEEWGVSIQALARRALDLELITDRKFRSLMTQISKAGWRRNEPGVVPNEEPTVLRDVIKVQLTDNGVPPKQLADSAFMTIQKLWHIAGDKPQLPDGFRVVG